MRRHSFLSSCKFLVVVLYVLISITRENGIVRGQNQCPPSSGISKPNIIVGYYPANNITSTQRNNIIDSISNGTTVLTHINYVVSDQGELQPSPSFTSQTIKDMRDLKNAGNPSGCKVLLSIPLSKINLSSSMTSSNSDFISRVANFVNNFSSFSNSNLTIDGVDLEYPICLMDVGSFTKLLNNLRSALDSQKILTITMGPGMSSQFPQFNNSDPFDFINIMAFQLIIQDSGKVSLNSPYNVSNSLQQLQSNYSSIFSIYDNISPDKIVFGVDFGGILELVSVKRNSNLDDTTILPQLSRNPFNSNPYNDNVTQSWSDTCSNPNPNLIFLWSLGEMFSNGVLLPSLCTAGQNWTRVFDETSEEPYLYKYYKNASGQDQYQFISYEDPQSLHQKIAWASQNYGGVAIADLSKDTIDMKMLETIGNFFPNKTQVGPHPSNSTINPESPTPEISPNHSKNPKLGLILGVTFGALLLLVLFGVVMFSVFKRNRHERREMSVKPSEHRASPLIPPIPPIPPIQPVEPTKTIFVTALYDFEGKEDGDLSFKKGDRIEVIERGNGPDDWWLGKVNGVAGEFPGNYVIE